MDGSAIAAIIVAGAIMLALVAAWFMYEDSRKLQGPRVRPREAPVIHTSQPTNSTVIVGGRPYLVPTASATQEAVDPCPWCLRMPLPGEDVVRCSNPHCRRIVHRAHLQENGSCGGVCGVL